MTVDGDWVELELVGSIGLADSTPIHDRLAQILADHGGRAFLLADITRLAGLQPDVRRQMATWNREHRLSATAVFGGSFTVRTIVTLVLKAIRFRDRDAMEVYFAKEEHEARRWLAARRAKQAPP